MKFKLVVGFFFLSIFSCKNIENCKKKVFSCNNLVCEISNDASPLIDEFNRAKKIYEKAEVLSKDLEFSKKKSPKSWANDAINEVKKLINPIETQELINSASFPINIVPTEVDFSTFKLKTKNALDKSIAYLNNSIQLKKAQIIQNFQEAQRIEKEADDLNNSLDYFYKIKDENSPKLTAYTSIEETQKLVNELKNSESLAKNSIEEVEELIGISSKVNEALKNAQSYLNAVNQAKAQNEKPKEGVKEKDKPEAEKPQQEVGKETENKELETQRASFNENLQKTISLKQEADDLNQNLENKIIDKKTTANNSIEAAQSAINDLNDINQVNDVETLVNTSKISAQSYLDAVKLAKEEAEAEKQRLAKEKEEADRLAEAQRLKEEKAKQEEQERLAKEEEEEEEEAEKQRLAKEKEEAEKQRLAKEKEEAEKQRLAKEEADRLAKEKEEAEKQRLAKEEADRLAKEKEEAEKQRLAKEKEEAEKQRLAKEKEEAEKQRLAKEKEEAEKQRLAKEEADRLAKEKEEAEKQRLAKEEADRLAKEKEEKAKQEEQERLDSDFEEIKKRRDNADNLSNGYENLQASVIYQAKLDAERSINAAQTYLDIYKKSQADSNKLNTAQENIQKAKEEVDKYEDAISQEIKSKKTQLQRRLHDAIAKKNKEEVNSSNVSQAIKDAKGKTQSAIEEANRSIDKIEINKLISLNELKSAEKNIENVEKEIDNYIKNEAVEILKTAKHIREEAKKKVPLIDSLKKDRRKLKRSIEVACTFFESRICSSIGINTAEEESEDSESEGENDENYPKSRKESLQQVESNMRNLIKGCDAKSKERCLNITRIFNEAYPK